MKLNCIDKATGMLLQTNTLDTSDIYYLHEVKSKLYDFIWYEYTNEGYEGSGNMLVLTNDGKWFVISLDHCSCYGPLDRLGDRTILHDTLHGLILSCTDDYATEIHILTDYAKRHGFK